MEKINFTQNEIWSLFISTFTGITDLTFTKIDSNEITFRSSSLRPASLFASPEVIKARVIHAYSANEKATPYLYLNGLETLEEIVDSNFLNDLGIKGEFKACKDDTQAKIINCNINANTVYQFKKKMNGFNDLKSLLQSSEQVSSIMLGNSKALKEDDFTGEESEYAKEIIEIISDLQSMTAKININYGKILKETQLASVKEPELTLSEVEDATEYTVNKNALLTYIQGVIPSGVIYKDLGNGQLQPILFQSMKADKPNIFQSSSFDFIIDISGSMTDDLPKIKVELMHMITKIASITSNWQMNITPFSQVVYPTKSFNKDAGNVITDISSYIKGLSAVSSTSLYSAMQKVYAEATNHASSSKNNVIITLTDGQDDSGLRGSDVAIKAAEQLRIKSPQSTMYNIGYKGYQQAFFDNLSKNTAAKTIHLDNIDNLKEFYQDMSTINNCKVMYDFGSKGYGQCAAGDIFVTPFTVSENTSVNVAGEIYNTGVELGV